MKEIGKQWNSLNAIQKGVYEQKARIDKDRYDEQMAMLPPSAAVMAQQDKVRRCRRTKKGQEQIIQKPKKVMSPYILFVKEMRPKYTADAKNSGKNFADIMRALGDMWKSLPV